MAINKISIDSLFRVLVLPARNKIYPSNKLKDPHNTLTSGDDNPLPGGSANGEGKGFPDAPFKK